MSDGIQTFMDCPDRKDTDLIPICTYHNGRVGCEEMIDSECCKRGYQR